MTDQVVFEHLHKSYDEVQAVVDLNLSIKKGEFFTLLGPSGSGKTTTLRMLAGLEGITSGQIFIDDKDVSREVAEKRNIGLVFQNYALFPHMTVADNVAFPLKMRRLPKAEIKSKVESALAMTQLDQLAGRLPRQLSGGQQQRVALARCFVFDPAILLMDEPLGALDRNLRDHMRLELKAMQARTDATVLYVTHDQDEALAMSDRIGIMHQGVLQQVASPADMYENPANSFVAQFLGDSVSLPAKRHERSDLSILEVDGITGPIKVGREGDLCDEDTGVFMIRPEKMSLTAESPDASGDLNCISGQVEATVYLGADLHVYLRDDAGARIQAKVPSLTRESLPVGSRHWLSWPTRDGRFLTHVV
jgi:putative spermidine/putrescine transport system ATP-binding protein